MLRSPGYLLMKGGHYIGVEFESVMAAFDLSGREFLVLSFARASDDLSQQQISERLHLDPTIVVGLIDALELRGLVERRKSATDRRRNAISLTAAGVALHDDAVAAATTSQQAFLEPLTAAEQDALRSALLKLLAARLPWLA